MQLYEFGPEAAENVLIQPVGDHDLPLIENEIAEIRRRTEIPFRLTAVKVESWNRDLSPWPAPTVFGNGSFGDGAAALLREILSLCADEGKRYFIGGYSMAGLFALWSAFQTEVFSGAAAASPSMWFPGLEKYMRGSACGCGVVYLSLGNREEKTANPVMRTVGDRIREGYELLRSQGVRCTLEWNSGGHFKEPDLRTAKAFAWVLENAKEKSLYKG